LSENNRSLIVETRSRSLAALVMTDVQVAVGKKGAFDFALAMTGVRRC
jgi:hypothetical protein